MKRPRAITAFRTSFNRIAAAITRAYTTPMSTSHFQRPSTRLIWVLMTVLAILYAQGLRVCIHGAGYTDFSASDTPASSMYLESAIASSALTAGSEPACPPEQDVSLSGILKDVSTPSLFLLFLAILIVLLPPRQLLRIVRPPQPLLFDTSRSYGLRPPLRAPPR